MYGSHYHVLCNYLNSIRDELVDNDCRIVIIRIGLIVFNTLNFILIVIIMQCNNFMGQYICILKIIVFRDVTFRSPLDISQYYGVICCLHLQDSGNLL